MAQRTSQHNKYWSVSKWQCLPAVLFTTQAMRGPPVCLSVQQNSSCRKFSSRDGNVNTYSVQKLCESLSRKYLWISRDPTHKVLTNPAEKRQALVILLFKPNSFRVSGPSIQQNSIQLMAAKPLLVSHLWLFLFSRAVWFLFLGLFPPRLRIHVCVGVDALIHCTSTWKTNRRARLSANPSQQQSLAPLRSWQCHFRLWAYGQGLSS